MTNNYFCYTIISDGRLYCYNSERKKVTLKDPNLSPKPYSFSTGRVFISDDLMNKL
jgi:hypothetical protein